MRTVGVYLLFAAVALRALVVFAGDPQLALVMALLTAYGMLLFTGPRLIRHRTVDLPLAVQSEAGDNGRPGTGDGLESDR